MFLSGGMVGLKHKNTDRLEFHMQTEFQLMSDVLELLGKRLWTLYTTDGSYGEFITTNRPVTLTFIEPEKGSSILSP